MDVSQAIDQANQQASSTAEGIIAVFFIVVVIITFSAVLASVLRQKALKCPKCGNWKRNGSAMQTVKSGNKTTTKRVMVCAKCEHEYSA
jgi:DNA-directed RNA polymerase subunit M/transcription elongation factor TFIIS